MLVALAHQSLRSPRKRLALDAAIEPSPPSAEAR
jgi:hypothetical protein